VGHAIRCCWYFVSASLFVLQFPCSDFQLLFSIWFWSRANIPSSITEATNTSSIDISQWGPPSASYPSSSACNVTEFFTPQQLVLDITLCGDWAGIGPAYNATCGSSGPTGLCYNDNVVGPGSPTYDNAFFEISYVRAYTTGLPAATPTQGNEGVSTWIYTPTSGTSVPTDGSTPAPTPPPTAAQEHSNALTTHASETILTIHFLLVVSVLFMLTL